MSEEVSTNSSSDKREEDVPASSEISPVVPPRTRRRAQTGPTSANGKATSSRNATRHGARGNAGKLLPGETAAESEAVRAAWFETYQPLAPGLVALVEQLAKDDRLLRHATGLVFDAELELASAPIDELPRLQKQLELILRYKTTHERSFARSLRQIEQFLGRRKSEELAERRLYVLETRESLLIALHCKKNDLPLPKDPDHVEPIHTADTPKRESSECNEVRNEDPGSADVSRAESPQEAEEDHSSGAVDRSDPAEGDCEDNALSKQ